MNVHPLRPDLKDHARFTIDSRLIVFGVAASLFLIVAVNDFLFDAVHS